MSRQIIEREISGFILELQQQGRDTEALSLSTDLSEFLNHPNPSKLVNLRDRWDDLLNPSNHEEE